MGYIAIDYRRWAEEFDLPNIILDNNGIVFDLTVIQNTEPQIYTLDRFSTLGLNFSYEFRISGNSLILDIFKIVDFNAVIMFFTSDVNREPYPSIFPEGILIKIENSIKYYRIYTIYEMSSSYTGFRFGEDNMYILRDVPEMDFLTMEFSKSAIKNVFDSFKFNFSLDSELFINVHNAMTSSFRLPNERNSLVPPLPL